MARYLLIAGRNYYPRAGTGNWIATFDKPEDAEIFLKNLQEDRKRQWQDEEQLTEEEMSWQEKYGRYWEYDWHEVVDLETYMAMHSGHIGDASKTFINLDDQIVK